MSDLTQQQMQRLRDLGILSEAKPGHVLECHVNRDDIGWHTLRTTTDFLAAWPKRPTLIPGCRSDRAYVGLFSEIGVQVFEHDDASVCEVSA